MRERERYEGGPCQRYKGKKRRKSDDIVARVWKAEEGLKIGIK